VTERGAEPSFEPDAGPRGGVGVERALGVGRARRSEEREEASEGEDVMILRFHGGNPFRGADGRVERPRGSKREFTLTSDGGRAKSPRIPPLPCANSFPT